MFYAICNIPDAKDDATQNHATDIVKIPPSASIYIIACATLMLMILSAATGRYPKSNGDFKSLYPADSRTLKELNRIENEFGSMLSDIILIDLSEEGSLEEVRFLEDDLLSVSGVAQVLSPRAGSGGHIRTVSAEGRYGRLLLSVDPALNADEQKEADAEIEKVLEGYSALNPARTGLFAVSQAAAQVVENETFTLVPIASLLFFILIAAVFRSALFAAVVLAVPLLSVAWVVTAYGLAGRSFGPISQLLPTFLISVGTSYSVHVAARLLESGLEKLEQTKKEVGLAVQLAAGTTIAGLLSLLLLDVQGVTEFAVSAALGVALAAWFSLTLTAAWSHFWIQRRAAQVVKKLYPIDPARLSTGARAAALMTAAAAAGMGIAGISFTTAPETFLRENSAEALAAAEVRRRFPGVELLSVALRPDPSSGRRTLTANELEATAAIKQRVLKCSGVGSAVSAADFRQSDTTLVPDNAAYGPSSITTADRSASRVLVESTETGRPLLAVAREVERAAAEAVRTNKALGSLSAGIASPGLLLAEQAEHLLRGVAYSLFFTLSAVALILLFLFRSVRVLLIGLLPNVIPVLIVFGSIGWLGWEVSVGVAIAGATALSIAVDDTFHLLIAWRESKNASAAIRTAFSALFTTSLVLVTGFFVLLFSQVSPIREYGAVMGCLLIAALLADTLVLPYLLSRIEAGSSSRGGCEY